MAGNNPQVEHLLRRAGFGMSPDERKINGPLFNATPTCFRGFSSPASFYVTFGGLGDSGTNSEFIPLSTFPTTSCPI